MTQQAGSLRRTARIGAAVLLAISIAIPLSLATANWEAAPARADTVLGNDDDPQITYSGWTQTPKTGYYRSDAHYSSTTGATAIVGFFGTSISWIGGRASDHGRADVTICDATGGACGSATTVDTFSTTAQSQQTLFTASGLTSGAHTMKITVRSDSSGSGHFTDLDAFTLVTPALTGAHYIDNGAGCSNAGAGTTTAAPWCDFTNLKGRSFAAGSQILLKRGDTFGAGLGRLYGIGTAASPITLGAYGTGARPRIIGDASASSRGVWIEDASYWQVRSLEIGSVGAGLVFWYTTNGHQGLVVDDLYTHDVKGVFAGSPAQADLPGMYHSVGLLITGNVPVTPSTTAVDGVAVTNIEGYANNDDFDISGFNANSGGQQGFLSTALGNHSVADVSLTNAYFHNALSGENFDNMHNLNITGMRLSDTGHGGNTSGTTALFFWSTSNVNVTNSILEGEVNTGSPDQTESDLEAFDDNIHYRGDYFGHSTGPALEFLEINGYAGNFQSNHEVSSNLFDSVGGSDLIQVGGTASFSGAAFDNISVPTTTAFQQGDFSGWTSSSNTRAAVASSYNAGRDFSATQGASGWREQYFTTGGGWLDINPYDSANERWGSNGYVARLLLTPDTCGTCVIARAWTAPSAGTVALRGQVVKAAAGGDGITARITKNGTQIWPVTGGSEVIAAGDTTGFTTNLNTTVATGDVIRFEVTNGGASSSTADLTGWSPSIAYVDPTIVNDDSSGVSYSAGWASTAKAGYFWGDAHYGPATGATATLAFSGTGVLWIGGEAPDHGRADVQVCNSAGAGCGTATMVDSYSATALAQQTLFSASGLGAGAHTLKITLRSDSTSTGHFTDVDRFIVTP